MPWVFLQSFEVLSCHSLYRLRDLLEMSPETRCCPVHLQVSESPLCLRIQGLGREPIKPACLGVFLNLVIPFLPKQFVQPSLQLEEISLGEVRMACWISTMLVI